MSGTEQPSKYLTVSSIRHSDYPASFNALLKYNVKEYRIVYNTLDAFGNPTLASGTLLVPQRNSPLDTFSVLSYQHVTLFSDTDVFNTSFGNRTDVLSYGPYQFASADFITIEPNYLGYNSSSTIQHPYFINSCSNRTVRDMLLASLEYTSSNLQLTNDGKLFLYGHSEGANVTVSALKYLDQM